MVGGATVIAGSDAAVAAASSAPPPADTAGGTIDCPQCGQQNQGSNRFCASCGYNLSAIRVSAAPAQVPQSTASQAGSGISITLTALKADGSEAGSFPLPGGPSTTVGRNTGSIFAGDSYLSPRHASFNRSADRVSVRDEGSLNGVYIKLKPNVPWPISYGDIFRIGQEIIRFEKLEAQPNALDGVERLGSPAGNYIGRLALVIGRDTTGNAFTVPKTGVHCGRERGDVLFSEDGYVSGLHCRLAPGPDGRPQLTDVGSSNGTFVRLNGEHPVGSGDVLLMGQQLFRVDLH
jgi:pSer/pThr/pTyr-binding forkhead associated (FHA) protein